MDTCIEFMVKCPKRGKMVYVGDNCRECGDNKSLTQWYVVCDKLKDKKKGGELICRIPVTVTTSSAS